MKNHEPPASDGDGQTPMRLLRAASDLLGGDDRLAQRLGMSRLLLARYMAGKDSLPPHVLLRTVDLLLEDREGSFELPGEASPAPGGSNGPELPA